MNSIAKCLRFLVSFLPVVLLFQASPACAIDYFDTHVSEDEKAVFSFFRAGNVAPDYERWIKLSESYFDTPKRFREDFFLEEQLRLGRGYAAHDNDRDLLEIRAPVIAKLVEGEDSFRVQFAFFESNENYTPTFDYPYVEKEVISLIVNNLASFSDLPVSASFAHSMEEHIQDKDEWFRAELMMNIRVKQADYDKPHHDRGVLQWIMIGEIGYVKCVIPRGYDSEFLLWDYVAPWHQVAFDKAQKPDVEEYPHPYDLHK